MLELKDFEDILEGEGGSRKSCSKRGLARDVRRRLGRAREILVREEDFCEEGEGGNEKRWLLENFPRLEETVKRELFALKNVSVLAGRGRRALFYSVFECAVGKKQRLDADEIESIMKLCCEYGGGISFGDTQSLLPLFRLCVCSEICRCFIKMYDESEVNGGNRIEGLFYTLDELLNFDEEGIYKYNTAEKTLYADPSGLYCRLSAATRASYRKNLVRLSKKYRISQERLSRIIVGKCKRNKAGDRHIGKYLADKPCDGRMYMLLVLFMTALFTFLLCLISPVFIVSAFSVYGCSRLIADKFFVRFFVKELHLPRLELSEIPDGCGVMTVITSLVTGGEADISLCSRLENMYYSNGGKNVYFGLLLDLCDSDEKHTKSDGEIISALGDKILELRKKYGNCFFLFIREREYSEGEERYIAPERKRGAVNALTELLCSKGDSFGFGSIKPDEEICRNIKYVMTLDSDTNLAFDCIRALTGIMLHPQNRPVIDREKNAVVKGYGILQPAMNPTLDSSESSFFSSVMCGHGGVDLYSAGGSDVLMNMFGTSTFCGKGMFDKDCFYELLCASSAFCENTVLSHDIPEGARLRCAYVPLVTLTDSFPSQPLSYYKRQHRWIRGDIQNLPFLLAYVKTADGKKIRNGIGTAAKFFIWHNVYEAVLPVFSLIALFAAVLCEKAVSALLVSAALSVYVLPFGYSVFMGAKRKIPNNFRRMFYSDGVYTGIWISFLRMLFRLCAIPKSAALSLDAISRSAYRGLVSHKKMLEWTTAAQNDAEKNDGLLGYISKNLVNAVCGALLFVLSHSGILRLLSLMWLFMPVFAYHSGKKRKKARRHIPDKQKEILLGYCEDMWKFFSENVSEVTYNLPTDNISLFPERRMSHMTSPTNIGLYLVCCLCALRLGLTDERDMSKRLVACLESIDRLEKHRGLLFNWYDIFTGAPLEPRYISSVDLGNYVACLICVKEGVGELCTDENVRKKIQALCERLIEETDFSHLFDYKRKLFYIGAKIKGAEEVYDRNRYDMLMSEARILSFCAVAKRCVPSEHMGRLSRRLVKGNGYMGLASWSGTAFEFFMPEIFMPSKNGSLIYEAICFAYTNMRKKGVGSGDGYVFGISESCYNEFDTASNYKYYAFGVPEIAVNVFEKQNVISPYSSFLCLKMSVGTVMKNLERLKKRGAYGEYGFYESVDFERCDNFRKGAVVKCFMSHHLGMSIAACANVLCDGVVSEWFYKDKRMNSARELTQEKIPYDAYVGKNIRRHYIKKTHYPCEQAEKAPTALIQNKKESGFLPAVVRESDFYLVSSSAFSFLAGKRSLGISFLGDMSLGRVSDFKNIDTEEAVGEALFAEDGFDLCKNSKRVRFSDNFVCYEGKYNGKGYSVEVYALADEPCKIIIVNGLCEGRLDFCVPFLSACSAKRHIGAGLVFFGRENDTEYGFAFGFCKGENEDTGASYLLGKDIRISVEAQNGKRCVFCIGKAEPDRAKEIYDRVRNELDGAVEKAIDFSRSIRLKKPFADKELEGVLSQYFTFPSDGICKRAFVKSRQELFLFDCLLLMFTDFNDKKEYLIRAFDREPRSLISKALLCLILCEYVGVSGNSSICELKIRGETLYKRCLSYLSGRQEALKERSLFLLSLERFSSLCDRCADTRTALLLMSIKDKIEADNEGGVFL